jgi:hypothetical protein
MPPIDPLADLKAEIAAEAAVAVPAAEETAAEEAKLAEEEAQVAAEEVAAVAAEPPVEEPAKPPAKKGKKTAPSDEDRMVPASRMNEYAVRVRQLEKDKEELEKKLNPPADLTPQQRTEAQIRAETRAQVRLEIQLEAFSAEGSAAYTQKAFDAACDKIAKLINGPTNLVALAIEATGSPKDAAKAIYAIGSNDAPEIEAFLKLSPIRQAAHLAKLVTTRKRAAAEEEEPAPRPRRRQVEVEEEELEPLTPLNGTNVVNESLGDDVPMDVWVERFDKQILNKGKLAH